jgi:hypothetical protein
VRSSSQRGNRRNLWHACVSVLLIGFLLYNPFIALISHSHGLAFQELARHRATVGSSEMQHYASAHTEIDTAVVIVEDAFAAPATTSDETEYPDLEQSLPQHPEFTASLWFRPPPTA